MTVVLRQAEAVPAEYPTTGHDALWQRIERHCAHRWTPRAVTWWIEGPGVFRPPLVPAVIDAVDRWHLGDTVTTTLAPAPLGGVEVPTGVFRVTATVGADNAAPEVVLEAFERLRGYVEARDFGAPGAHSLALREGQLSTSIRRKPEWLAQALVLSGAADLLRGYRRP